MQNRYRSALRLLRGLILVLSASALLVACQASKQERGPLQVRVGYFPNITHAQALVGLARGDFQKALGDFQRRSFGH
jgi:NitT/TauT family transport system substrate-binding protein